MYYLVPLNTQPNNIIPCMIPISENITVLEFFLHWNIVAQWWEMSISDISNDADVKLIEKLPLINRNYPDGNLLEQFEYMELGKAFLVALNDLEGIPNDKDLGVIYNVVWSVEDE